VAATPDSPSPYTRVFTGSPDRVVQEDVVEKEAKGRERGLDDPEPDHYLVLFPAQEFEVVVDRGHFEDPPSGDLEDKNLDDDETASSTKSPPITGKRSSVLVSTAAAARTPPIASDPVSPIKMSAGWELYQRNPTMAPTIAPQISADVVLALEKAMAV
jgi:hypothetical protein